MNVLLISCYELGHQPFALASAGGHLLARGHQVECLDLAVQDFDVDKLSEADFVGISIPMHTAIRLGVKVGALVREVKPQCHICYFGLYASLNEEYLIESTADTVIGGEFETPLADLIDALSAPREGFLTVAGVTTKSGRSPVHLGRQEFVAPARNLLPDLARYAKLQTGRGDLKLVGYVEASRGCAHRCRHCPIPAVYEGRLRILQRNVVLDDIGELVSLGAEHIDFGDPDFLNGVKHSLAILRQMHEEFPQLTFNFTAKIEHLLEHRAVMAELSELNCIFIQSAVEAVDDATLRHIDKGHTAADVVQALEITRRVGIALRPTFLPFTPWTTLSSYLDLLEFVESQGLVYNIAPVQYSIRLLLPPGSLLLQISEMQPHVGELVQEDFVYEWKHPDPRVDELQRAVAAAVETSTSVGEDPTIAFYRIKDLALSSMLGRELITGSQTMLPPTQAPPRLTEDWFC